MPLIKMAIIQSSFAKDRQKNIEKMSQRIEEASKKGAHLVLMPELFETPYFPREKNKDFFGLAKPLKGNETIQHFQKLAAKHKMYIPISFFEKDGDKYFNSMAFVDHLGQLKGVYRKTFIPSGPGYEEKFYFQSGDTGFKVWETSFGRIGIGICWDQWFPEAARAMVLKGADILLYPTCIGSEPEDPQFDTKDLWQKVMIGHAVANVIPIAAANRVGQEGDQTYYGSSFIANHRGNMVSEADRTSETILYADLDFEKSKVAREDFGLIKDLNIYLKGKTH